MRTFESISIPEFIQSNDRFYSAAMWAHTHHEAAGQSRESTGEPYIVHPMEVAELVFSLGNQFGYHSDWIDVAVLAALLHDTIEDTEATYNQIEAQFGAKVRNTVFWLTDVTQKSQGNRRVRKELEIERLTYAPARAKFIKCADIIANARTIIEDKPGSSLLWLTEKIAVLSAFEQYNTKHKGTVNPGKLDKRMLDVCRRHVTAQMDKVSKP